MALESSLQEISAALISVRATERKKNAESLKNFLTGNAVPALLSNNSLKKRGYNWNNLFDDIHEYILKELEKYETSKTFYNVTAPLCTSLLHLCVAGSNKGRTFICCDKLTEACLYILKDKRMATAIGDAYLNLLYKHVLTYDQYVNLITPATWEELLDVCIDTTVTNHTKLDNFTLFRLIWLVIKKGKSCCQFVIPLRNALPKLKKCFQRAESDKKIQEIVTEITILLLEMLSSESRLTMCEFTEGILPFLLKCYDQNADQKKKASVFKLLNLIILLHHPEGKLRGEEGSLANSWPVWSKYLHSIMEITCLEANYLQKSRKPNDPTEKNCIHYFHLASSVYFQNFNLSIDDEFQSINSSKRQRISLNNYKCISDLTEELRAHQVPWLGIIDVYVQNYDWSLTTSELLAILTVVETLVSNNSSNLNWNTLEQLTCSILNRILKQLSRDNKEQLSKALTTLWNSCVRNSSSENNVHKPMHGIMQRLLELDILHFQTVQPLLKLYFEKSMPVTDPSIKTLGYIYHKYYSNCSYPQERRKCLVWLLQDNVTTLSVDNAKELFLRLMANNNLSLKQKATQNFSDDAVYQTLFVSAEKCTLFSEGVLDISIENENSTNVEECFDLNVEIIHMIQEYLLHNLKSNIEKSNRGEVTLLEIMQFARVVVAYFDVILQSSIDKHAEIENNELYCKLKNGLKQMSIISKTLKETRDVRDKLALLQCFQELWLTDHDPIIDDLVRKCVDQSFFAGINEVLSVQVTREDDEAVYEENDAEFNPNATRHNCILLLAAYCRKSSEYREEILDLILDPVLYDFTSAWDVKCAFQCIQILIDRSVTDNPLASIFTLMRNICKELFRNSEATETILKILLDLLERIWAQDDNIKQNCLIMVKSYLQRSQKLYYPPHVAALVYRCVAKITELNYKSNSEVDCLFKDALIDIIKDGTHALRLYTCYLLNAVFSKLTDFEIESFLNGLVEIFVINVSGANECILKDESANRTLTVLHSFLALAQSKPSSLHKIVTGLLLIQKEKSLDSTLVKKFLNKITKTITSNDIETYLQNNILSVINVWLFKNNTFEEFPISLLGLQNYDTFLEEHMKWLIPADILWLNEGNVKKSDVLNLIKNKLHKSEENIVEICFSYIITLCLPYVVTEKYNLSFLGAEQYSVFKQSMNNAIKMFQTTRQILENEKWSNLFVENMAELLLMTAMHVRDRDGATELFQVSIPQMPESYLYPKTVFYSILKYFGELIDGNIMQYLCSNQAITIFDILFKLWENVVQEKVFQYRLLSLYTFIMFVECIPLGFDSDAYVCNFTCNSFLHAIKASKNKDEVKMFVHAMRIVLMRWTPEAIRLIKQSLLNARSVLLSKKEEGYGKECEALLKYLSVDLKEHLKESEDVVDFSNASPGAILQCATKVEFSERLKAHIFTLSCPSHEALTHLQQFVKLNKQHAKRLCEELNTKRFSEECKTSVIHQVIYALSNIMKSSSDDKIIIEACNCLSEIGTYDLKTLVVVPPADTKCVIHLPPTQCFTFTAVAALSEVLSDEDPAVTNKAVAALSDLFKYREGKDALIPELGEVNISLLKPFFSNCNENAVFKLSSRKLEECSDVNFWIPLEKENHYRWLTRITSSLLGILASATNYLNSLREVCIMKPTLFQHILPGVVGLLLNFSPELYVKTFSDQINIFFEYIWKMTFDGQLDSSGSHTHTEVKVVDHDHKMIILYMLDVVNFVRLQKIHYKPRPDRTALDSLNYLRLEYDKVACAASMAGQNFVAIFYGELWAVARNEGVPPSSPEGTTNLGGGDNIQRIFRKCFVSIGEVDAIDGCGTAHLTSEDEIRKRLMSTGQYWDALVSHDVALWRGAGAAPALSLGVARALHEAGVHHLALQYIQAAPETDQLNRLKYDCLTSLGDWSKFVDTQDLEKKSKSNTGSPLSLIKAFRYACLKDCLGLQTGPRFETKLTLPLRRAKLAVSSDIEEYFSVRCGKMSINSLLNSWKVENLPSFHDFKHLESLISQRSLILEHAGKANRNFLKDIVTLQLQYVELGLENDRVQMAQRLLSIAKDMQSSDNVSLVEGQVAWAKGHKEIALSLVRNVMGSRTADAELTAASLRQYGMWMAESRCENPRDIINKYLTKSLDVLDRESNHLKTRFKVYHDIAKFADSEYKQVVAYMSSTVFENKLKCIESMKDTVVTADSMAQQHLTKDEKKVIKTTRELSNLDEAEVSSTREEKQRFMELAMKYYLLSLAQYEENNLSVFRVVSLWLAGAGAGAGPGAGAGLGAGADAGAGAGAGPGAGAGAGPGAGAPAALLARVPARKFLAALPQLAPRLSGESSDFAANLTAILKRCAQEHPHHTLPILFSLKNADKDLCILNASGGAAGAGDARGAGAAAPRSAAAAALVAALAASSPSLAKIIAQMEKLCDATISFANYKTQAKEVKQKIPSAELIHRLGPLDATPVPIDTITVRSDCNYSYVPTIVSFDNYFELVGGINCPKKINCRSSDGKRKIVLVKGEDDLRQDAVMQQVFDIVNTLLENNPVTSRNKLLIRTYKVVPMSRQSGVLEWCEGTLPLGEYLVGRRNDGAHARYRPQDISCTAARQKFTLASRKSNSDKLKIFLHILNNFKPVFHHFFTEHYLDPVTWYERRLAYTKSVATSSMVGYILGLGDRHVHNILIDKNTAEVVHIDFGIAFDQGKALPTPETIPFRLTQDMIAGFGCSGVEGIFRKSCEKTMQLLRDNNETLLTILEVLLCDPLYSWTTKKIPATLKDSNFNPAAPLGSVAELAARALLAVGSKLSGTEAGAAGGVACAGQVARLLHCATDPNNLSRLFQGWQPYL